MKTTIYVCGLMLLVAGRAWAEDDATLAELFADQPEQISVYDPHEQPGQPKAKFLADMKHRLIGPGKISDVRSSRPIEFMGKEYFTRDAKEATLGSLGTLDKGFDRLSSADDSFIRFGFNAPEFRVKPNQLHGNIEMNGRSLASFTGSARFEAYANLSIKNALLERKKTYKVSFVAADLIAKDVIAALNKNPEVTDFLTSCRRRRKTPMYIMSNVIMLDTKSTQALDTGGELEVSTIIDTGNALSTKVSHDNEETITLSSPVIRCYEMFEVLYEVNSSGTRIIGLEPHRP